MSFMKVAMRPSLKSLSLYRFLTLSFSDGYGAFASIHTAITAAIFTACASIMPLRFVAGGRHGQQSRRYRVVMLRRDAGREGLFARPLHVDHGWAPRRLRTRSFNGWGRGP